MDKQQAAEKEYPYDNFQRFRGPISYASDKNRIDELRKAYIKGWETHEAQSPSDAVAILVKALEKIENICDHDDYGVKADGCPVCIARDAIHEYKLFNPSVAATQAGCPTGEDGDLNCPVLDAVYEGAAKWEERCRSAEDALKALVNIKQWKDRSGKDEIYKWQQPLAWAEANNHLATYYEEYEAVKREAVPPAKMGYTDEEKDLFAMQFVVFALTDPRAQGLIAAHSPVGAILALYKDRPYLDEDTSKQ